MRIISCVPMVARLALGLAAAAVFYLLSLQATGNFHEVVEGELYRSAQMSAEGLARYGQKYQIRSVINLRGENGGQAWYDAERSKLAAEHIQLIDFKMSSKRVLPPEQVAALIAQMRAAPKPLLIHCRAGADRTGLAVALYMAAMHHQPEAEAKLQLSPFYGHFPFSFGAPAMDETFKQAGVLLSPAG